MNLLERVLTLLRANLNSVVEKADDPEKALRQLQQDMHNQLVQVKTEVAKATAESHTLQKRGVTRKAEADSWLKKAEHAVQQGNDDAARTALTQYNNINKLAQRYHQQQKEQEQLVTTMRTALRQLETKLAEVDTTIDLLVTRKRNALIQQRVMDALNKTGNPKHKEKMDNARDAVLDAEVRARALADLQKRARETLLGQLTSEQQVEQQLQQIKENNTVAQNTLESNETKSKRHTLPLTHNTQPHASEAPKKRVRLSSRQTRTPAEPSTDKDLDLDYLKKLLDAPQSSEY
jgi:phage shock protein A